MWLIGANLVREQRWLATVLAFYVVAITVFLAYDRHLSVGDVAFLVKQQAIYAVMFSALLALSTLHNERKTRRILAVLSKSVTRAQYLGGLLLGMMTLIGGYCALVFLAGMFLARRSGIPVGQIGLMVVLAIVAALLAASVGLLFASLFHPIVATAATGLALLGLPVALAPALGQQAKFVLPVYALSMMIGTSTFELAWGAVWPVMAAALAEALVVGVLAVGVFSMKDIAVAVE
jgi:ABC-type transport system involved in multi-copper enzyme maturation permease subunit